MARDEKYLREAADRIMIQDLLGRYAFAIDYATHNPMEWAELFVEIGRFEIPEVSIVVEGRAALRDFAAGLQRTIPGIHHVMTNFVIDIDGDRARGKCELNEFMLRPEAIHNNFHGWYEDDYVFVDGRWRIEVRRVHVLPDCRSVGASGKIGEYFRPFFDFCRQYVRKPVK
ncbi:MAG: nuclear transport factor 2 family protein [Nevskia sp.]|nr:nuclear transport factor 2 family protein [Nevskia sp.]